MNKYYVVFQTSEGIHGAIMETRLNLKKGHHLEQFMDEMYDRYGTNVINSWKKLK